MKKLLLATVAAIAFGVSPSIAIAQTRSVDETAQAQCDKARAEWLQWSKEQCGDPSTALALKKRMFARRYYGGELTDVEWDYLKRNPPADQRAEIEPLAKEEARLSGCDRWESPYSRQTTEICRRAQPVLRPGPAAPNLAAVVTASEIEGVRNKMRPCWESPGRDQSMIVTFVVSLGRNAVPVKAELKDTGRYSADPAYRAAADAAHRAIMNPRCQPWPLNPADYEKWKVITFNFDARDY